MGKKKGGHRRGLRVGKYVNVIFKVLGLVTATTPAIKAVGVLTLYGFGLPPSRWM